MVNELGAFLRARRTDAALEPAQPSVGSRRVTGLRREEVAAAAGISVDYYIRLEQGRETNPSDSVLSAVARVLRLDTDATQHLRHLRDGFEPVHAAAEHHADAFERMEALVQAVEPNPAYVLDRLSNIVAANEPGLALFDGMVDIAPQDRNTCRYLFTHPRAKEIFLDWEDLAKGAVGHLRSANADDLDEPGLRAIVAELSGRSGQFADWWSGHVVHRRRSASQRLQQADGSHSVRRYEVLHLPGDGMRMTIWLPAI
jgi:transcriptional regulator with XRE-family HTH domain